MKKNFEQFYYDLEIIGTIRKTIYPVSMETVQLCFSLHENEMQALGVDMKFNDTILVTLVTDRQTGQNGTF